MEKQEIIQLTDKIYHLTILFPKKEPLRYKIREKADDVLSNLVILRKLNPGKFLNLCDSDRKKRQKDIIREIEIDLEVVNSYLEIAKYQNWVSYFDILEVEEKYSKIKEDIEEQAENLEKKDIIPEKPVFTKEFEEPCTDLVENEEDKEEDKEETSLLEDINKEIDIEIKKAQDFTLKTDLIFNLDHRKQEILNLLKEKEKIQVWEVSKILPDVSKRTLRRDFVQLLEQDLIERIGEKNETYYRLKKVSLKVGHT